MGKGGSSSRLPMGTDALSLIQAQGARKSIPVRNETFRQLQEALETGGVNAKIPLIQRAVAASKQATSQAVQYAAENLSDRGVGGPFRASQLAQVRQTGEAATSALPTQIVDQLLNQGTGLAQVGYPGSPISGSSTTTTPDTATPAIGAGAAVAAAVIAAI